MCNKDEKINWKKIFNLYNTIKWLYALCEETDPDLMTNLQPLNEFRAALDHLMRLVAIEKLSEYKDKNATDEAKKLCSHLRRAFFDICDMISINYRNKIIDLLQDYSPEEINHALPTYYSTIRPRLEKIAEDIALLRTDKRFNSSKEEENAIDKYPIIIEELQKYCQTVSCAIPSLIEIRQKNRRKHRNAFITQWVIPIGAIIVTVVIAIIGWAR